MRRIDRTAIRSRARSGLSRRRRCRSARAPPTPSIRPTRGHRRRCPRETPHRLWYTPLLLVRQEPESISLRIPCSTPPALRGADDTDDGRRDRACAEVRRWTRRHPRRRLPHRRASAGRSSPRLRCPRGCSGRGMRVPTAARGPHWAIDGGPEAVGSEAASRGCRSSSGSSPGLDLRSPDAPTVDVTTTVHDTRTTARQTVAWVLATAALVAALSCSVQPSGPVPCGSRCVAALRGPHAPPSHRRGRGAHARRLVDRRTDRVGRRMGRRAGADVLGVRRVLDVLRRPRRQPPSRLLAWSGYTTGSPSDEQRAFSCASTPSSRWHLPGGFADGACVRGYGWRPGRWDSVGLGAR